MTNSSYRNYRVGIGVSLLLAALIATLSLIAVATPNLGWGVVALATVAIWSASRCCWSCCWCGCATWCGSAGACPAVYTR